MYLGIILLIVGVLLVLPKIPIFKTILGKGLILMGLSLYLNKDVKDIVNLNNIAIFGEKKFEFDDWYLQERGDKSVLEVMEKYIKSIKIKPQYTF